VARAAPIPAKAKVVAMSRVMIPKRGFIHSGIGTPTALVRATEMYASVA